jgi:hypothetical protein
MEYIVNDPKIKYIYESQMLFLDPYLKASHAALLFFICYSALNILHKACELFLLTLTEVIEHLNEIN